MRVLITGGAGFAGANLGVYLADRGHLVTAMDNLARRGSEHNLERLRSAGVEFRHGDVRCREDWHGLKADFVVNAAAQPSAIDGYGNPTFDFEVNTVGVLRALEFCRAQGAGIVQFGTNKIYPVHAVNEYPIIQLADRHDCQFPVSEDTWLDGGDRSIYGCSKIMADLMIQEWADAFGMPAFVNRCSCLAAGTKVETAGGTIQIEALHKDAFVRSIGAAAGPMAKTNTGAFKVHKDQQPVVEIRTKRGRIIRATKDHLFYCPGGYKQAGEFRYGQFVEVHPTINRPHTSDLPNTSIYKMADVISAFDTIDINWTNSAKTHLLDDLRSKGLDTMSYNHPMIYVIARLAGYAFGDGHIQAHARPDTENRNGGPDMTTKFYDKDISNLETIRADIAKLGFTSGAVRTDRAESAMASGDSTSFCCGPRAFSMMLHLLGVPIGKKAALSYGLPEWIKKAPAAVQNEFMRGFFGAEMRCPGVSASGDLHALSFTQCKHDVVIDGCSRFNNDLAQLLNQRGIGTKNYTSLEYLLANGEKSRGYEIRLSCGKEALITFLQTIGYAYNKERERAAFHLAEFLSVGLPFKSYEEWRSDMTVGVSDPGSPAIWDFVVSVEEYGLADVYDITVPETRNFIANGFHVHNCLAGPWQWGKCEQGWVAWWVIAHRLGLPLKYIGFEGRQVRDVLFIEDLCRLLELELTQNPQPGAQVFNVGGGRYNTLSLRECTAIVRQQTGRKVPIAYESTPRRADFHWYVSDLSKVQQQLAWTPTISPAVGIARIDEWVRSHLDLLKSMYGQQIAAPLIAIERPDLVEA